MIAPQLLLNGRCVEAVVLYAVRVTHLGVCVQVDLAGLYLKTGVKNQPTALLLTDAQIPDEHFLVVINDLLASGIP